MLKLEYFKEFRNIGYRKWYTPIGRVFDHVDDAGLLGNRIYITRRLLETPIGSFRLSTIPKTL
jgi:hypothetical protein